MPGEIQNVSATALPDVQGMIEQLMRLIPGMMVTVAGGVVTSMLPGKIKIAGLPIVGYGMFMVMDALRHTGKLVVFQPEPTYPTQASIGEVIHIIAWAHNISPDIQMVRMRLIDRDTGEEIGPEGHIDWEMNPDAGTEITWTATMIGPNDAHIKLELGVLDATGSFMRTDFRDIDIACISGEHVVDVASMAVT